MSENSGVSTKRKKHSRSRTGALWLAPVLLLCLSVLIFTVASQPYFDFIASSMKVFFTDSDTQVSTAGQVTNSPYPVFGEEFATITIDSIGLTTSVYQGDTPEIQTLGVTHYYGSKLPGDSNNTVLTAHRTMFFSRLGELKPKDRVTVKTGWGDYVYEVVDGQIINTIDEMSYAERTPTEQLTLITCYPFDFLGAAPQRYVVRCKLVEGVPHDWGLSDV